MTLRIFTEPQQGASYEQLLRLALHAEASGFGAFFRSDHVLAMGSATGQPRVTDAWITLAGLARDTTSIRLGTLVTPVTFRAVGTLPVTVAQVDEMSGGRVEIGVGAGWYDAEHDAFGLPFPDMSARYDLLEDQLAVLHGVWTADPSSTVDIEGRTTTVHIDAATVRPVQTPHPPIVMGGQGKPRSADLAVRYANEYNAAFVPGKQMKAVHERVRAACEKAGRDPATMTFSLAHTVCCAEDEAGLRRRADAIGHDLEELRHDGLAGTPRELIDKLNDLADLGAQRFYLQVLDISDLDHLSLIAEQVAPHVDAR